MMTQYKNQPHQEGSSQEVYSNTDQDIDSELEILEVMAEELEDYIVDESVYRTIFVRIRGQNYRLMMSGGNMLARLQTLQAMRESLTGEQKDRLNTIITQVETTRGSLQSPFQKLLLRELKSRLAALNWSREEEETEHGEAVDDAPADSANHLPIAIIRQDLADELPRDMEDEVQKLEPRLQQALEQLTIGQVYQTN